MPDGSPWPRVTVVTPSYNQGRFLEETIRSVLLQGYPNLEYMVIDGGSTDETVEVIHKYEPWLAHWESEPDRGQSHAINKGWTRATGEVLAWLNSDDIYTPGALGKALRALAADPEAAVVFSNVRYIDERGETLVVRRPGEVDFARLLRGLVSCVPQPTAFTRKAALDEEGLLDEEVHYSMDYDLWLRISRRWPLRYVDTEWACTRFHKQAKTVAGQRNSWEAKVAVLDKAFASSDLPEEIRSQERSLYSEYFYRTGCVCLREGAVPQATRYLARAVTARPGIVLERPRWRKLLALVWRLLQHGPEYEHWPV